MMTRLEAWLQHLALLLVGGTGVVLAVLRYLLESDDPYAVVNHPLEPAFQHYHVLAAPLLVFAGGLIWRRHVSERWRSKLVGRRRSGIGLAIVLPVMIMTGYLLQVAVDPRLRKLWLVLHLSSSAVWIAGYAIHQLVPRQSRAMLRELAEDLGSEPDPEAETAT